LQHDRSVYGDDDAVGSGGMEMSVEIKFFSDHGRSPAVTMGQRMHLELLEAGLTSPVTQLPVWNDPALVAYYDGEPVGAMIYRHDEARGTWFILSSYVAIDRRRQGIHTQLFKTLVERARKRGDINSIECGTHVRNLAAQRSFEQQGRKASAIFYEYRLKDFDEPADPLEIKPA
jgi:ribosomal protein S18 acetylase RimI-like enzyme